MQRAGVLAVAAVIAVGGCGLFGSPDVPPSTSCADRSTLKNCYCLEDEGCKCTNTTCAPGACVSTPGGAFCAMSGAPWPACDAKVPTQSLCDGTTFFQCSFGYRAASAPCSGTCVSAGGTGICATSTDPWPGCDPTLPSQYVCDGNTPIQCQFGYRTLPLAPGRGGAPCSADQRCISDGATADCVVGSAILSPACPPAGRNVFACLGTTGITCMYGYIVDNRRCASCSEQDGCKGGFQSVCATAADCASGYVCQPGGAGNPDATCEVACSGTSSGNPQCASAIVDTSLPYGFFPSTCGLGGWCGY